MTHKQPFDLYIASCTPDGGIYRYQFAHGNVTEKAFAPLDRPMYMAQQEGTLYVLLREYFPDGASGLATLNMATMEPDGKILSTMGKVACHLSVDTRGIYTTNYVGSSVARIGDLCIQRTGSSIHPQRQASAHPHCIVPTPDGNYLLLTDLGTDQICVYNKDLSVLSQVDMIPGSGPRHLAFSQDGAFVFCANELNSTLSVLSYHDGKIRNLYSLSTLPEGFSGENTAGAIRCAANRIYVSNRGHDSVAEISFNDGQLKLQRHLPVYGKCPRDIWIHDDLLIVANQFSNNVSLVDLETGDLQESIHIPTPLCIIAK